MEEFDIVGSVSFLLPGALFKRGFTLRLANAVNREEGGALLSHLENLLFMFLVIYRFSQGYQKPSSGLGIQCGWSFVLSRCVCEYVWCEDIESLFDLVTSSCNGRNTLIFYG